MKNVKVSFKEKKAWVDVNKTLSDDVFLGAVKKAGPYKSSILKRIQSSPGQ